jgi:hypothetical protein
LNRYRNSLKKFLKEIFNSISEGLIQPITFLLLLISIQALAQTNIETTDSTDTNKWQPFKVQEVKYTTGINNEVYQIIDTSLQNFQVYDPALQAQFHYRTTGNIGLAAYPVFFQPNNNFGFNLGYNAFDLYRLNKNNIRKFKSPTPFTEFNMMIGPKREQMVNIFHSQTIKNRFSFNFEYNRIAGKGIFRNQQSNNNNFSVNTAYISKKQRYTIGATFIYSNVNAEENGGFSINEILYKDTTILNKELIGVNLGNAQTGFQDRDFSIKQQLAFGKTITKKINDTISITELAPVFKIYHHVGYSTNKIRFIDKLPDTSYYNNFYTERDTIVGNDSLVNSISMKGIYNTVGVQLQFVAKQDSSEVKYKNFLADINATHYFFTLNNNNQKNNLQNLNLVGVLSNHPTSTSSLIYSGKAAISFISYNAGDLLLEAKVGYKFKKAGTIEAVANQQLYEPAWVFQQFSTEYFSWNNSFKKTNQFGLGVDYTLAKYRVFVSGRLYNITNLLYTDEDKLPQQFNGNTQVLALTASKNFRYKGFGLDNLIMAQWFTGNDIIRMPATWLRHSIYLEGKIFKGALQSRFGIDMTYNTNYFANGYFPLTGQFYLQNITNTKFYPTFDVWFSFKIKTFRIFLKVDHVNEGLFKQPNYYNFYNMPATQRAFRIGLSWRFYD